MLCDHQGALGPGYVDVLFPNLAPGVVAQMLGRTAYSSEEEREAETLASMLQERVGQWTPKPTWDVPAEVSDVIERLGRSLDQGS